MYAIQPFWSYWKILLRSINMLDDILLFVKVVEAGSILSVEKMLNISKSTISRRIQTLEESLGDSLFNRTTHGVALTMLGHNLYARFKGYESKLSDILSSVSGDLGAVTGRLNVLLPYALSDDILLPRLNDFLTQHPRLQLNITHSANVFNMQKELYDIAVINYLPKQQNQKFKLIAFDKVVAVCTPEYVDKHGLWDNFEDHAKHLIVGKLNPDGTLAAEAPLFNEITGEVYYIKIKPKIIYNNFAEAKRFVLSNNGIAALPLSTISHELDNGKLIRLFPDYHVGILSYHLMRNIAETDSRYIVFMQFLQKCLSDAGLDQKPTNPKQYFHI